MRRVAIYMRVSSDKQAKEGESLEFQRNLLLSYIKSHPDMVLMGEYMDDGVSGTKFEKRDELQRMLTDAKEGKIDVILFTKLDRFFRSVRHLMNTLDALDRYGVEWKAIQEAHDNTTPTGKLALTIMGAFAEMEANMDSIRVRDAFENKRQKKEWLNSRPPFGYKIEDKHAVPDPEKAEVVVKVFKDYIRDNSIMKLIRDHAHEGTPRSTKGMKHLLSNSAYIGEMHGQVDYLTPIIDRKTFDHVQRLLSMNVKSSVKHTYLFSGLLICPCCGKKLTASTYRNKYPRYTCRYHMTGMCEFNHVVYERRLESFLIDRYKEDLEKRYLSLKEKKKTDNTPKIKAIYRKIDRLKDLYVNEFISMSEYRTDLEKYREELKELEKPQEDSSHIEELLKLNVYEIYHTLTREQKRRLWRSVVKSITVKDDSFFVEYV